MSCTKYARLCTHSCTHAQAPQVEKDDAPPLPSINCWYSSPMEAPEAERNPPTIKSEKEPAEEDDYFSPEPDLSHLLAPSSFISPSSLKEEGAMPAYVFSSWLSPPPSFSWDTTRLIGIESMRQIPDSLFQPLDLSAGPGTTAGAVASPHHWIRLSLLAAVFIDHLGWLTFWWAKMTR